MVQPDNPQAQPWGSRSPRTLQVAAGSAMQMFRNTRASLNPPSTHYFTFSSITPPRQIPGTKLLLSYDRRRIREKQPTFYLEERIKNQTEATLLHTHRHAQHSDSHAHRQFTQVVEDAKSCTRSGLYYGEVWIKKGLLRKP